MWKIGLGILATLMVAGSFAVCPDCAVAASQSTGQPIHLVLDMDKQPKFEASDRRICLPTSLDAAAGCRHVGPGRS